MSEVRDLMTKAEELAVAHEDASVSDIAKVMAVRSVGTVLVTDGNGKLCGLVTDRKITTDVVANNKSAKTAVKNIMTERPEIARANNPVCVEVQHMKEEGIRRIPVVGETGQLLGVLSIADVAKEHARDCERCTDNIMHIESRYV
jgi:predicted transcriptional regulator